jgi:hypothetical protein
MNVFVLSTGRCGSVTFDKACSHISNYSSAHESRARILGDGHFEYPVNHIEIDNRLSWFLGRLDKVYGQDAFYVHLTRDMERVANSYKKRFGSGIIRGYAKGMMMGRHPKAVAKELCLDYCKTVNSNIELFLKDKPLKMDFALENAENDFTQFWQRIGAEGDFQRALAEWKVSHNSSSDGFSLFKLFSKND